MLSNGFVSKYFRSVFDIEYTIDFFRTYIYRYTRNVLEITRLRLGS